MFHLYEKGKELYNNIVYDEFPKYMTIILAGAGLFSASKHENPLLSGYSNSLIKFLLNEKQKVPTLPIQQPTRPVFVFDVDDFIGKRYFDLSKMQFVTKIRAYSGTFLFNMAYNYELVALVNQKRSKGEEIIRKLDPYGCIAYGIFLEDKKDFKKENLNRNLKKTIFIATKKNEYSEDFNENVLRLPKWDYKTDDKLMQLLNFSTDLVNFGVKDFRTKLVTYKNKNFYKNFGFEQRKMIKGGQFFIRNFEEKYQSMIKQVNDKRVDDYLKAKKQMDVHLQRDQLFERTGNWYNKIFNLVMNFTM